MAIGDILSLQVQGVVADKKITNDFAYRQTAGDAASTPAEELNSLWNASLATLFRGMLSSEYQLECFYTRGVTPLGQIPDTVRFLQVFGSVIDAAIPANASMVLSVKTSSITSKKNGRVFISGLPFSGTLDGLIDFVFFNAAVVPFIGLLTEPLGPLGAGQAVFEYGIVSRFENDVKLVPPQFNDADTVTSDLRVYGQSRRATLKTGFGAVVPP